MSSNAYMRDYLKKRRDAAKRKGLCGQCTLRPCRPGGKRCAVCYAQERERETNAPRSHKPRQSAPGDVPANLEWMADILSD